MKDLLLSLEELLKMFSTSCGESAISLLLSGNLQWQHRHTLNVSVVSTQNTHSLLV